MTAVFAGSVNSWLFRMLNPALTRAFSNGRFSCTWPPLRCIFRLFGRYLCRRCRPQKHYSPAGPASRRVLFVIAEPFPLVHNQHSRALALNGIIIDGISLEEGVALFVFDQFGFDLRLHITRDPINTRNCKAVFHATRIHPDVPSIQAPVRPNIKNYSKQIVIECPPAVLPERAVKHRFARQSPFFNSTPDSVAASAACAGLVDSCWKARLGRRWDPLASSCARDFPSGSSVLLVGD